MRQLYRNNVIITSVINKRGKQFAFGVIMEVKPRTVFFPSWIVTAYDMQRDDQGATFDCIFVDQEEDKHPMVLAVLDDDMIRESDVVGEYAGRPGQEDFTAIINKLNRKER